MATILAFAKQEQAFNPEMTSVMAAAFEAAWEQLADAGDVDSMPFKAEATRETLAKRIIDAARRGVRDPDLLRHEALVGLAETSLRRQG